ncbi:MAG: fatty acid desaturase [Pseudomonadota bacterium]|nr:fatty acid desaturase [Pseudomonadota bacterium]
MNNTTTNKSLDLPVTLFLLITPVVAIVAPIVYLLYYPLTWDLVLLFVGFSFLSSVSITAGYHRLLSHRSYKANGWLKNLFLFFGGGTFQSSALEWVADHRMHHRFVDTPRDPYNIKQGFMHAHISWLFHRCERDFSVVPDLLKDRWIMWQRRYFLPLAIFSGFIFPALIALIIGQQHWLVNILAGLIFGGVVRIVFVHHCTFFVNSICHMWGSRPYSEECTARDNPFIAFLTNGEGYHNFHHRFQYDYRNGTRWYHYDPTKWLISFMALLRQTSDLRRVPHSQIVMAKLALKQSSIAFKDPLISKKLDTLRSKAEQAHSHLKALSNEYQALKKTIRSRYQLLKLKADLQVAKIEFDKCCKQWSKYLIVAKCSVV